LEQFWFKIIPDRFLLSLSTFFLSRNNLKSKPTSILFDPFHKIFYGVFLMIKRKKSRENSDAYLSHFFAPFSKILFQKPEQEKQEITYFIEKTLPKCSNINEKIRFFFFFFTG